LHFQPDYFFDGTALPRYIYSCHAIALRHAFYADVMPLLPRFHDTPRRYFRYAFARRGFSRHFHFLRRFSLFFRASEIHFHGALFFITPSKRTPSLSCMII